MLAAEAITGWMSVPTIGRQFFTASTHLAFVRMLGGTATPNAVDLPWASVAGRLIPLAIAVWIAGAAGLRLFARTPLWTALDRWGRWSGAWGCAFAGWEAVAIVLQVTAPGRWDALWGAMAVVHASVCLGGLLATYAWLLTPVEEGGMRGTEPAVARGRIAIRGLAAAIVAYVAVYYFMNVRLYQNLFVPHGDSVMYEEHLWNLLHGKGFRSYLDQGLFLGEHIQVIHLAIIPAYLVWPSHLLLELAESTSLALGAWPVYRMVLRKTDSPGAAFRLAVAYLLYTPMHFLDIAADLKTFRPEAFGAPLLLWLLDRLDEFDVRGALAGVLLCLAVKEDLAVVLAPLGLWVAWNAWTAQQRDVRERPALGWIAGGLALAVGSVVYLWFATRVAMPWFRSGAEIHYASYFSKFGKTPEEIVRTMLGNPWLLGSELLGDSTWAYAAMLLAPAGFIALLSPTRLMVGAPLFGVLCLNELSRTPQHHFHAPLVAILFWATAGGLGALRPHWPARSTRFLWASHFVWTTALACNLFMDRSPLSVAFWDPAASDYWNTLYGPTKRAETVDLVVAQVPATARVASTDFIHPRFTHHARSYDYSDYRRAAAGYRDAVPDDTEFIVIDLDHAYSTVRKSSDIRELREQPDRWELLPDKTGGLFAILRRRASPTPTAQP